MQASVRTTNSSQPNKSYFPSLSMNGPVKIISTKWNRRELRGEMIKHKTSNLFRNLNQEDNQNELAFHKTNKQDEEETRMEEWRKRELYSKH